MIMIEYDRIQLCRSLSFTSFSFILIPFETNLIQSHRESENKDFRFKEKIIFWLEYFDVSSVQQ